jgi:NADH-quinone oxidoreductase subunit F
MHGERLRSTDAFRELRDALLAGHDQAVPRIVIPAGTCGQASGANDLIRVTKRELLARRLVGRVRLRVTGCHGFCEQEPSVLVLPYGTFYPKVDMPAMARIVEAVARGIVLEELLHVDPVTGERIERQCDLPFFRGQRRSLLARSERADPIYLLPNIREGSYSALLHVLEQADPAGVIDEVKRSGLRGRGGAGFATGVKWELLARQPARRRFLVCNADEGDPGAYMDRSLLEGNPHAIIEGMLIGAFATGATEGVIYVRAEYPLAIKHLLIALRQARELGLLGDDILGTGFAFDIGIVKGAGAFVCGEETALIRSIEGHAGEPRQRPPFPVERGIEGQPTAINNVETWANIPLIIEQGGAAFAAVGTARSTGTKIFSLVGRVRNTGLVEVPMGIPLRTVVEDIGGGPPGRVPIKAVQTGGPSGGCIPAHMFDLPIDYESLKAAGSIMGSGGMIVMDANTCMVDVARYFMGFLKDESCGKCFTCRKGTQRMYELLDDIASGAGTPEHLPLLRELAEVVRDTSMCGLGRSAPNPVLSTLDCFAEEYRQHIEEKRCAAYVCERLVGAPCATACPLGTEAWRYVAHIQRGELDRAYHAIREANPFPSVCARVCNHPCEERCRAGRAGGKPVAIRMLKRFVTDRSDPASYVPRRAVTDGSPPVAIVGAGPAGLTAAHYLSLAGHRATVFERESEPGGMLYSAIPAYRLPRAVIRREIDALLDENVTLRCGAALGRDFTIDSLLGDGFGAVFVAIGAHESLRLGLDGESLPGVIPSITFLRAFNVEGRALARGRVGIIGGGNSAVDAARVALRQPDVSSVTILYRRTREEMPAFEEEVDAALEEGVRLETLVAPVRIRQAVGRLGGVTCVRNRQGRLDASGRRRPEPIPGSEHEVGLDTLIVAISEGSDTDCLTVAGANRVDIDERARVIRVDAATLRTSRAGVFAGGDVATGPNTVVDAIAAGKRAAVMIGRYLRGERLERPAAPRLPQLYVEAAPAAAAAASRIRPPRAVTGGRPRDFDEIERALTPDEARREAGRCLRCDLDFTKAAAAAGVGPVESVAIHAPVAAGPGDDGYAVDAAAGATAAEQHT